MNKKSKNTASKELDIAAALGNIPKEKSVSMDLVLDSLSDALSSAARKYLGIAINVETKIDREKGGIEVYTRRTVVKEVDPEQEEFQISLEEARKIDDELEENDELIEDLDVSLFGRTAIQTAKQVIIQRVREAEREKVFDDFSDRVGELVTGTVQQIDKGNVLINLGRTEALLPFREQIRKERYRQGDSIKGCIIDVRNNTKGPQVIVSRTCPEFLARLFEIEVPEIFDKTVRIVKVVRDPGHRSKIAVSTSDERVDPVGACVGMRGNRVQAIVRELSNERIDIINWTTELSLLVRRTFSPAEVKRVYEVTDHKIVVIIKEEDLAQAIGREGQNIRLSSRLLDREIDVYGDEEFSQMTDEEREDALAEPAPEPEETPDEEAETTSEAVAASQDTTKTEETGTAAVSEEQEPEKENTPDDNTPVAQEDAASSADESGSEEVSQNQTPLEK